MYCLYFTLNVLPQSLNVSLSRGAVKWRHKYVKRWHSVVHKQIIGKYPEKPLEKYHIKIIRHYYRFLDYDNLTASMKPIVDALKGHIIKDDTYKMSGPWDVSQEYREKAKGPLIEIWIKERTDETSMLTSVLSALENSE